ncbi:chromatin assembly factor 1 subunit A-domain-containing protein [Syncephalastrum racemosum]|uniref:Chromatin assembly factor 1 subunit A-domain-containing protein n=1 Tax=Syncephalastrum racemosum TaxID=13706 RepID=A0A1X2HLV3_SYNRA|nr:chromatin assembly factor 1 subunit A-domain-containing protein [Syncephalastrum racemosum]
MKKEEEKRVREEERRKKEEEKRKKEEEKRKKEEEKRLREDERRKRDEERKKKEQSQLRLTSLFHKAPEEKAASIPKLDTDTPSRRSIFPPFYVKEHVKLHYTEPITCSTDLSSILGQYKPSQVIEPTDLADARTRYVSELRERRPELCAQRGIKRTVDLRSLLLGPELPQENSELFKKCAIGMKLLQFAEDVRPAYWGTWTKISDKVSGRTPFAKEETQIDYEHDSEAEWEPEGEGEDIQSGDEDDDEPAANIDPEDAGWLVPEGYLSEGEGVDEDVGSRPAARPPKKYVAARPIIVGPSFEDDDESSLGDMDGSLQQFGVHMLIDTGDDGYNPFAEVPRREANTSAGTAEPAKPVELTVQQTNELINIVEGKADAMQKLITEAKTNSYLKDLSKRQIELKIKDLAVKEKRGTDTKAAWHARNSAPSQPATPATQTPQASPATQTPQASPASQAPAQPHQPS